MSKAAFFYQVLVAPEMRIVEHLFVRRMIDRPFPSLKIQADRNFAISLLPSQDLVAQLAHEGQYQPDFIMSRIQGT